MTPTSSGSSSADRVAVTELARQAGSFYRELKALNPEIVEGLPGLCRDRTVPSPAPQAHGPAKGGRSATASLPRGKMPIVETWGED